MYEIEIDSELFQGKRLLQQHRMVNEVCSKSPWALDEEVTSDLRLPSRHWVMR